MFLITMLLVFRLPLASNKCLLVLGPLSEYSCILQQFVCVCVLTLVRPCLVSFWYSSEFLSCLGFLVWLWLGSLSVKSFIISCATALDKILQVPITETHTRLVTQSEDLYLRNSIGILQEQELKLSFTEDWKLGTINFRSNFCGFGMERGRQNVYLVHHFYSTESIFQSQFAYLIGSVDREFVIGICIANDQLYMFSILVYLQTN